MLDKEVIKFTRDGIQKQNLATGDKEMLTESDHAKQIRYNPLQSVYNSEHFAQSLKEQNRTLQHYKTAAAEKVTKGQYNSGKDGYYKLARKNLSERQQKQLYSKTLTVQQRKHIFGSLASELKSTAISSLKESDDTGLQAVGKTYQIAEDTEKAAKKISQWQQKARVNQEMARRSSEKAAAKSAEKSAYRAAAARQQAMKAAKVSQQAAAKSTAGAASGKALPALAKAVPGKYVAIAFAVLLIILLLVYFLGCLSVFSGSNTNTDLTDYVKQLDDDFLHTVEIKKAEYEAQPNTEVKIVGMDLIHTDGNELALLATTEWSMIDLTDANKKLLKSRYDVLHTYEISETNQTDESEVDSSLSMVSDISSQPTTTVRHITISIHVYSPEERIDKFGFTQEQKAKVLEVLPVLRQISAAAGATGSIIIEGSGEYAWPVPGFTYISSSYGDTADRTKSHTGVDIAGENIYGKPIVAAADGTVTEVTSGWGEGYGNSVLIDHGDSYTTRYAHCSSVAVHKDEIVKKGQVIAYVGSTGDSTGPHCHFEIRKNGTPINPMPFITGIKGGS